MILDSTLDEKKGIPTRYLILLMIFVVTAVNYGDRATLSIAGTEVAKELGLSAVSMGYIFSAFGWAYLLMQIPGGWLLDKYGSRLVYGCALIGWSVVTMFQGTVYLFASPLVVLVLLRLMMGAIEAPAFPANSRLSVQWFPNKERGFVTSVYQAAQYISLGIITPLMTIILHNLSWHYVFYYIGAIGVVLGIFWLVKVKDPSHHPKINPQELDYIREGGGVPELGSQKTPQKLTLAQIKSVCVNRMMIGVYIGQFCVTSITWFFLTWFPIYLVQDKGMSILKVGFVASIPALFGFAGGVLGGLFSDYLIGRGCTLTFARKLPIVLGMLLASSIILCNYTASTPLVITLMALAFFGKGFGALGWPVISDVAPKEIVGLCGGVFNVFGNVASIATPLVIGYIVSELHSFNGALIFVGGSALMMMVCYLFVVGDIKRMELQK